MNRRSCVALGSSAALAGDFAGLVTLSDIRKVPRDEWPSTSVYRAMTPATRLHSVSPDESLAKVLQMMATFDVNQLPVIRGRDLVGMLNRADVLRYIQVRQEIGDTPSDTPVAPGEPRG